MGEQLEKEKFDRTFRKKEQKRAMGACQSTRRAIAPTTAAAFSGPPQLSCTLAATPKSRRPTTPQKLKQQRGAEIAMSRKQQPNSIESKTLITYNLKKEELTVDSGQWTVDS